MGAGVSVIDHGRARYGPVGIGRRDGLVQRPRVITLLQNGTDVPVVAVVAGAGFGKSTAVSQWLDTDGRSVAWVTVTAAHDDPTVLATEIVRALDTFEPLEPRLLHRVGEASLDFTSVLVPTIERAVGERGYPFVLVLDDVHRLTRRRPWAIVQAVADALPDGSQLVLVSRTAPQIALGRLRGRRRLLVVDAAKLAMGPEEAALLFESAQATVDEDDVDRLVRRTEGWPAALYLAALTLRDRAESEDAVREFAEDDRNITDYVQDEVVDALPRRQREFLLQASILAALTPAACDAVLERRDSAAVLAECARQCLLVVPFGSQQGYRLHPLVANALRNDLRRRTPERWRELHRRASAWMEGAGDPVGAVEHALASEDGERIAAAIWSATPIVGGSGGTATMQSWFDQLGSAAIRESPALAISAAWAAIMSGELGRVTYWSEIAARFDADGLLPDGGSVRGAVALLHAVVAQNGIEQMRRDAALAYELDDPASPYRGMARVLQGAALRLAERPTDARVVLEQGLAMGQFGAPAAEAQCRTQLVALAIEDGDWDDARAHVRRLNEILESFGLGERPAMALAVAMSAFYHAQTGDAETARDHTKQSLFLLSMLTAIAPWSAIEARLVIARTTLLLGDLPLSRVLLKETGELLPLVPDCDVFRKRLEHLVEAASAETVPLGVAAAPLTPAEMRVLRYLPTHLTLPAIADELCLSRHTVKSHCMSIYRKLGVTTRGEAVALGRSMALLDA